MTLINRKTDYATRVLLHLAMLPEGSWTTTQAIAQRRLIPERLIGQIVSRLAKAGLLVTRRGKGGGICIAGPASDITLLQVYEAMQGPLALNLCVTDPQECELSPECPLHEAWVRAQCLLTEHLQGETLDQLATRGEQLADSRL